MKTRGRTSAAALEISALAPAGRTQRPDAPYDLTDEETEEWRSVVNRLPADWFPRETHGLLTQYCRHAVRARRVAQLIQALEDELAKKAEGEGESKLVALLTATKPLDRLLKMQERESRALSSLATRMRISQQGSYDAKKAKGPIQPDKNPWDY